MHRLAVSRPRWFATLGCLVALSVLLGGIAPWTATSALAHNWNYCGDGGNIRWAGTSTNYYHNCDLLAAEAASFSGNLAL